MTIPGPPVGIFWDLENGSPPRKSMKALAQQYIEIAQIFGQLVQFYAFFDFRILSRLVVPGCLPDVEGLTLVDCPHSNKSEQADKRLIVDMLAFSHNHRPGAVVILISQDADFYYALSSVRRVGNSVVVMSRLVIPSKLRSEAHLVLHWEDCQNLDIIRNKAATLRPTPEAQTTLSSDSDSEYFDLSESIFSSSGLSRSSSFAVMDDVEGYGFIPPECDSIAHSSAVPSSSGLTGIPNSSKLLRWVNGLTPRWSRKPAPPRNDEQSQIIGSSAWCMVSASETSIDLTESTSESSFSCPTSESEDDLQSLDSMTSAPLPLSPQSLVLVDLCAPSIGESSKEEISMEIAPSEGTTRVKRIESLPPSALLQGPSSQTVLSLELENVTSSTARVIPTLTTQTTARTARDRVPPDFQPLYDILQGRAGDPPLRSHVSSRLAKLPPEFCARHQVRGRWVEYLKKAQAAHVVVHKQDPKLRIALHPRFLSPV